MATFLINTPGKNTHVRRETKEHETIGYVEHAQKEKNTNTEMTDLEERYQEIVDTMKKAAAKKENEVHDTRNNVKDQVERENPAAAEAENTLAEAEAQGIAAAEAAFVHAVAQEIERRSMMRSSTVTDQRAFQLSMSIDVRTVGRLHTFGVMVKRIAVNGTRRQGSEYRINAHTRLWKSNIKMVHMKLKKEVAAAAAATCWQGSDCRNNAHTVMSILNTIQKNISACEFRIRMMRQVLSCSIPAATRASSGTTTKKHT